MKTAITAAVIVISLASPALAKSTSGYMRNNGTYVMPYQSTNPNSTRMDNYSTRGNVNPYTGKQGYANPFPQYRKNK